MKRIYAIMIAAALLLTLAAPALAQTVTDAVYGVPPCEKGQKVGNKHCRPQDVPEQHFAVKSIATLVEAGIFKGDPEGNFMPDKQLSAGESLTVMLRVLGIPTEVGTGSQHWAAPAVQQAKEAGLVDEAAADPDRPMTRVDMAILIAKALKIEPIDAAPPWFDTGELSDLEKGYLAALYKLGVFKGYPDGTFGASRTLTRAELAILVDRILNQFKQ